VLVAETAAGDPSPPVRLPNFAVDFGLACVVRELGGAEERGVFTSVRCDSREPELHRLFLEIVPPLLLDDGAPESGQLRQRIKQLIELFRSLSRPSRKTIHGLWGEIFVICTSSNPLQMIRAWHTLPTERFDFADGAQRLEVKTAGGGARSHVFGLEQVRPPEHTSAVIASLIIDSMGGGKSVSELVVGLPGAVRNDPAVLARVNAVILETLGEHWRQASESRFDQELARQSLRFLDARSIPAPQDVPVSVTDVHFRADVSCVSGLPIDQLRSWGGLFAAALPRIRAVRE